MDKILNKEKITDFIKKTLDQENLELECIFDQKILNKDTFLRLLNKFKEFNDFENEENTLDIRCIERGKTSNIRISINGLEEIKQYCKTDSLDEIENPVFIKKELYKEQLDKLPGSTTPEYIYKYSNQDFDYRINIKTELPLNKENPEVLELLSNYNKKSKFFRYKKRYSFITYDKLFRFDLTVIKSSPIHRVAKLSKTFKESNILNSKEIYEMEIEYIGSDIKKDGTKSINAFYKDLMDGKEYESPYNLYYKVSPNPHGIISPMDFVIHPKEELPLPDNQDSSQSDESFKYQSDLSDKSGLYVPEGYDPEEPLYFQEPSETKILKKAEIDDDILGIDENIELFKAQIEELEQEEDKGNIEDLKEFVKEMEDEKNELLKKKKELDNKEGGAKKIPEWAKKAKTKPATFVDNELLSEKLLTLFEEHIYYVLSIIFDTKYIISNSEKRSILEKYKILSGQKCKLDYIKLQIPQPVTLTLNDVNPNNPKSILLKYAVTEKADGDRYVLYIVNNQGYLINSKKNIIFTGVKFPDLNKDYLFDGEYITKNINDENIKLFMIFDVYYENMSLEKNFVHKLPFHSTDSEGLTRLNIIKEFKMNVLPNVISDENSIRIDVKNYEFGNIGSKHDIGSDIYLNDCKIILNKCNNILRKSEKNAYEYRIDGLIFIPLFHSVKGTHKDDVQNYIGGKWCENFKWKPPDENSIDFQVRFVKKMVNGKEKDKIFTYIEKKDDGSETLNKYKQLQLLVGYSKSANDCNKDKNIDYCMKILDDTDSDEKGDIIPFNPEEGKILYLTNIKLNSDNKKVICERDKKEIKDNDIVEMRYNPDATNSMVWEPLRIRDDKIDPQFFTVANSVWDTIQNPISVDFITNKENLKDYKEVFDEKNKYYVSKDNNPITASLRKLHNYIKSKLIVGVCSSFKEKINILDISFGRGGDIQKYIQRDANAKFILGLDISSNITEACERYYNERKDKPKAVFLVADTSQKFSKGDCFENVDATEKEIKHSETMLNILYNNNKPVPKEYKKIHKKFNNLALKKFNVISSQFSLHYYFEDEVSFEGLMNNIKSNIAPGGYFIGTCYDGNNIFKLLKEQGDQEFKDLDGSLIYSIEKKYDIDDFTFNPENLDNIFGQKIDVYMESIGQVITEYLVNFKFLKQYMEQNGFKLMSPTVKKKYSNIFKKDYINDDGFGDFEKVINNLPQLLEGDKELQAKGYYEKSMEILKNSVLDDEGNITELGNEKLRILSSLNNYFIFKKV